MSNAERLFGPAEPVSEERLFVPELIVRKAREDEMPWVFGTWANSHASKLPGRRRYEAGRFRGHMHRVMNGSPNVFVMASGTALHAWACADEMRRLHYAYVPKELRGNGFAKQVIQKAYGGYPDKIAVTYRWPFPSERFIFEAYK